MNFLALPLAVLVFLLPGSAWLLLSGLLRRLNVLGAIAVSFLLSICLLSLASAFLSLITSNYLVYAIALALILPTIIVAAYLKKRGFSARFAEGASVPPLLLLCLVVYLLFLFAYFWSSPHYPTTPDPLTHAQVAQSISRGEGRTVLLQTNFPVGLHFVTAIMITLLGMNAVESLSILASLVLLTSLVLIFVAAHALFKNEKLAVLATVVGGLILPADAMHFVLIGTYPNLVEDAIVFAAVFLLFSYLRAPALPVGLTLALLGLAGVFIHSSYLLFLAALWLLFPVLSLLHRGRTELQRYFQACIYCTIGILVAALVALSFLKGNVERVLESYSITHFIGGTNTTQLIQSLGVVYGILAYNMIFLIKPANLIAIALALIFVAMKGRQSVGAIFAACWFAVLVILSLLSGQTDRFVLFSMIPSIFLVGYLVGNIPIPNLAKMRIGNRRLVLACVLLILVVFGGFLPLISVAFSPSRRMHEQDVFASMEWLEQNRCPSGVASLGLDSDFRYLPILTNVQYSGSLPSTITPDQTLQESTAIGFSCVVMQANNPNLHSFQLDPAFQEKYLNAEVAVFFISK